MIYLFATESYYPENNGVSLVVQNLAKYLTEHNNHVNVVTGNIHENLHYHDNVNIFHFNVIGNASTQYQGEIDNYINFVINFKCDYLILECTQIWSTDLILSNLDLCEAKKIILHSHDFSYFKYKPKNPIKILKWVNYYKGIYKYIRKLDWVFVLNSELKDAHWLNSRNIQYSVLENGVEESFFCKPTKYEIRNVQNEYGLDYNQDIYICVANYEILKDQELVLTSFIESNIDAQLVFIGNNKNKYSEKLSKIIKKHKLDNNIKLLSNVSRDIIRILLWGSKAFLYGSKVEAVPLVILEAIVTRTPFISTNVGSVGSFRSGIISKKPSEMATDIKILHQNSSLYLELLSNTETERNRFHWENITIDLQRKLLII
jgi:glycosyltransferase involved in cell wall biosynthesis